jgi:hypothetical protein
MSIPAKGTRGRALLDYLATIESQDIAGVMEGLVTSLTEKTIRNTIGEMYLRGHVDNLTIEQEGDSRRSAVTDIIALTQSTRYELEDAEDEIVVAAKAANIVPPRDVNYLNTPPLDKSRYIKTTGTRDGSDWSQFPSCQL